RSVLSSRRRHTRSKRDWSSDVCSSDLPAQVPPTRRRTSRLRRRRIFVGWTFILPNFLGFALLTLVPVAILFYLGFTSWNAFGARSEERRVGKEGGCGRSTQQHSGDERR